MIYSSFLELVKLSQTMIDGGSAGEVRDLLQTQAFAGSGRLLERLRR
jgi:hypothetical protein